LRREYQARLLGVTLEKRPRDGLICLDEPDEEVFHPSSWLHLFPHPLSDRIRNDLRLMTANASSTNAGDHALMPGTLTFSAGQTSRTMSVTMTEDMVGEYDQTMHLNLSKTTGNVPMSDSQAPGAIVNVTRNCGGARC